MDGSVARRAGCAGVVLALGLALGCGVPGHPLVGEWELDPDENRAGLRAMLRETGDDRIVFEAEGVRMGEAELPVRYEVGETTVRVIRTDRDAEHAVDLLEGERIRVHFPAGFTAVYRRAQPADRAGAG